jgi:RES domain-containing protein
MRQAWRIVKEKYAASAFDGEGASRTGGRWNSRGTWLVYTSATQSLAALETLVHLNPPLLFRYVAIPLHFDEKLVETLDPRTLPENWREEPAPPATRILGDDWVDESRSAILEVPSVVVPTESNYLLNPAHRDFRKIKIGNSVPFAFDPRLL